jgi:hypothetical protein
MVHKDVELQTAMCFGSASTFAKFHRRVFHLIRPLLANQSTDTKLLHSVKMKSTSSAIVFVALATGVMGHVPAQAYGVKCKLIP